MKKITILLIALVLCAYSKENTQMANPWQSYNHLEDAQAQVSFDVTCPKEKGAIYQVVNNELFEMDYDDVHLRKSVSNEDNSGDYNGYDMTWNLDVDGISVLCKGEDATIHCAIWYRNKFAYSMTSEKGMTEERLNSIVKKFQ